MPIYVRLRSPDLENRWVSIVQGDLNDSHIVGSPNSILSAPLPMDVKSSVAALISIQIPSCSLNGELSPSAATVFECRRMISAGALEFVIADENGIFATAHPQGSFRHLPWTLQGTGKRLSSRALLAANREGSGWDLRSTVTPWTVRLPFDAVVDELAKSYAGKPITVSHFGDEKKYSELLALLEFLGFLVDDRQSHDFDKWENEDIWFHLHSRDRSDSRVRGLKVSSMPPGAPGDRYTPRAITGARIELPLDFDDQSMSSPLGATLMQRRSSHELQELLSIDTLLSIAINAFGVTKQVSSDFYDYQLRPYPSAGGLHELELFCLVSNEILPGNQILYFDPIELIFMPIDANTRLVSRLLEDVSKCWGKPTSPRAAFILASRHGRISWKYAGIAYRCSLIDAGCALQTIALASQAHGIQGCPAGTGNSELFSACIGEPESEITSIAEFGFA